jgi:hypothetical protein
VRAACVKAAISILVCCSALLVSAAPQAEAPLPEQAKHWSRAETDLARADRERFRAMVDRDISRLSLALADELVYVHSSSTRQSKSEHLHDTEVGRAVYRNIEIKVQEPRLYNGRTGVIQGIAAFTTGADGHESAFTLRYTDVYVMRDGRWQMVAWHCTRMPDPPDHP